MTEIKPTYSIEVAKDEHLYRTDVLNDYEAGTLTELQNLTLGRISKIIYKVQSGTTLAIFKTISCPEDDQEAISQAKEEYTLAFKMSELNDGVAKPLKFKEVNIKSLRRYLIEAVYEYCGQDVYSSIGEMDGKEAMDIMTRVAEIMTTLEAEGIPNLQLKSENICKLGDTVKIMDLGVNNGLQSSYLNILSKAVIGESQRYLPPEVLKLEKELPGKVDVYTWGMVFYQLLSRKDNHILDAEAELRVTDYQKFIENVSNIQIQNDSDGSIKTKAVEILLRVLDIDREKRPTFADITPFFLGNDYYSRRLLSLQKELLEVTQERDELKKIHSGTKIPRDKYPIEETKRKKVSQEKTESKASPEQHESKSSADRKLSGNRKISSDSKGSSDRKISGERKISNEIMTANEIALITSPNLSKNEILELFNQLDTVSHEKVNKVYNEMKTKKEVLLDDIPIGDVGAKIIAEGLTFSKNIEYISLGFCRIGIPGIKELVKGFEYCKNLKKLLFGRYNDYHDGWKFKPELDGNENFNNFGAEGTRAIAKWIDKSSLKYIDLSFCNISKEAMEELTAGVNCCKTLVAISIAGNSELKGRRYKFKSGLNVEYIMAR